MNRQLHNQIRRTFYTTAAGFALAAFAASPAVLAEGTSDNSGSQQNPDIQKSISTSVDIDYAGDVTVGGHVRVDALAAAVTGTHQNTSSNAVRNDRSANNATVSNSGQGSSGNIGINMAAGDNNTQANSTAISAVDAANFVFGHADAETFATQTATANNTRNIGAHNNATLTNGSLRNAAGNIGVNIAAGNSNAQQNSTSISLGSSSLAVATTSTKQLAFNNNTHNTPSMTKETRSTTTQVNMYGVTADYQGWSDQANNVYPDTWSYNSNYPDEEQHSHGPSQRGHFDVDSETQGAADAPSDSAAYDPDGAYLFKEAGTMDLSGTASVTNVTKIDVLNRRTVNNASLNGGALQGATGNVGVNIASGTNNLQSNSLAISMTTASVSQTGGGAE